MINAAQKRRIETYLAGAAADRLETLASGTIVNYAPKGGYYVPPTLIGRPPENHGSSRKRSSARCSRR